MATWIMVMLVLILYLVEKFNSFRCHPDVRVTFFVGGSLPVLREGSGKLAVASLVVRWRSHHQEPVAQVR